MLTNVVSGPGVDWQHRHPEAMLCIGDALADSLRKSVPLGCDKTALKRFRLKDPPNNSGMGCDICSKGLLDCRFRLQSSLHCEPYTDTGCFIIQVLHLIYGISGVRLAIPSPVKPASMQAVLVTVIP